MNNKKIKSDKVQLTTSKNNGEKSDLWGAMRGTVTIAPGVDLTESTGEIWDAEQ